MAPNSKTRYIPDAWSLLPVACGEAAFVGMNHAHSSSAGSPHFPEGIRGTSESDIIREMCQMDALKRDKLNRKWKKHADEIELEIIQKLQGNSAYHVVEVARASLKRFGVEKAGLRKDSFVIQIEAAAGADEGRRSAWGWLCFESELDALLYLSHVWFRHIKTNCTTLDDAMTETIELVEKAMGITLREGGFGNDVLKDIIVRAIGRLVGISLSGGVYVNDGHFESEITEGCSKRNGRHTELADLAASGALDIQNQKHLKMVESWMTVG
jgi:hypothetical protein